MGRSELRKKQAETLESFKKLSEDIYYLEYKNPYYLDAMLERGVENLPDMLAKITASQMLPEKMLKAGKPSFACTSFDCKNDEGDHIMGRNFDFKRAPCVIVKTAPEDGYRSIALSDANFMLHGYYLRSLKRRKRPLNMLAAPYSCVDGMNEKGLAVSVLEVKAKPTSQHTGRTPIGTTVAIRGILDRCANVKEAVEFLRKFDMRDPLGCSYHYQIIDADGESVIVEYVGNEMRTIYPSSELNSGESVKRKEAFERRTKFQSLTNFFLSPDGDNRKAFGYKRFVTVQKAINKDDGILDEEEVMRLLEECRVNTRNKIFRWRVTTLWSVVYNTGKRTLDLCAGLNYGEKLHIKLD